MKHRKYTKELLEKVAKNCTSIRQMLKYFSLKETGGNYKEMKDRCVKFNIDISHFNGKGWNKFGHPSFKNNIDLKERFSIHKKRIPSAKTKDILFNRKLKEKKCEICGCTDWLGKPITLQLHHKNGNPYDDRLENLQILCPNCHSQTHNFCRSQKIRKSQNLSAPRETLDVEPS